MEVGDVVSTFGWVLALRAGSPNDRRRIVLHAGLSWKIPGRAWMPGTTLER